MRTGTIIAIAATVAVVGGVFGVMEFNRSPAGADAKEVVHTVSAEHLFAEFQHDEAAATTKYVGTTEQVIEVTGEIRDIDHSSGTGSTVILETGDPLAGIVCEFSKEDLPSDWKAGDQVTVKGFCKGMLMDVLLQRCVAVQ